jgi:hypothetical protein
MLSLAEPDLLSLAEIDTLADIVTDAELVWLLELLPVRLEVAVADSERDDEPVIVRVIDCVGDSDIEAVAV